MKIVIAQYYNVSDICCRRSAVQIRRGEWESLALDKRARHDSYLNRKQAPALLRKTKPSSALGAGIAIGSRWSSQSWCGDGWRGACRRGWELYPAGSALSSCLTAETKLGRSCLITNSIKGIVSHYATCYMSLTRYVPCLPYLKPSALAFFAHEISTIPQIPTHCVNSQTNHHITHVTTHVSTKLINSR